MLLPGLPQRRVELLVLLDLVLELLQLLCGERLRGSTGRGGGGIERCSGHSSAPGHHASGKGGKEEGTDECGGWVGRGEEGGGGGGGCSVEKGSAILCSPCADGRVRAAQGRGTSRDPWSMALSSGRGRAGHRVGGSQGELDWKQNPTVLFEGACGFTAGESTSGEYKYNNRRSSSGLAGWLMKTMGGYFRHLPSAVLVLAWPSSPRAEAEGS